MWLGEQAWLQPVDLPLPDMLQCKVSGRPLDFLLQVCVACAPALENRRGAPLAGFRPPTWGVPHWDAAALVHTHAHSPTRWGDTRLDTRAVPTGCPQLGAHSWESGVFIRAGGVFDCAVVGVACYRCMRPWTSSIPRRSIAHCSSSYRRRWAPAPTVKGMRREVHAARGAVR